MLRAILFDMDGVLVDSIPSIHASTNYALLALGRAPVEREDFLHLVGPPLEHAGAVLPPDRWPFICGGRGGAARAGPPRLDPDEKD